MYMPYRVVSHENLTQKVNAKRRKCSTPRPTINNLHLIYQSSSSSCLPCIACCRARRASAKPPARLAFEALLGVPRPLAPDESPEFTLAVLSRGAGGGAGLRPAMLGRLAGGAGGAGLVFAAAAAPAPFVLELGVDRGAAAGGGGGAGLGVAAATISSR